MRVILCNQNKISKTILPEKIEGSFWLVDEFTENNIINIEAVNGKWVMKSNDDARIKLTSVIDNLANNTLTQIDVVSGKSCYLEYENRNLFCFFENSFDNTISYYTVSEDTKLVMGSNPKTDIYYEGNIDKECLMLEYSNGEWNITIKENTLVYINDYLLRTKVKRLNFGDNIFINGIRMVFYKGMISFNNIEGKLKLNSLKLANRDIKQNINFNVSVPDSDSIKEVDLYKEEDYFFKKARIRRFIETYDLKVTPPPGSGKQEEMPLLLVLGPMATMAIVSIMRFLSTITNIINGESTLEKSMSTLITSGAMLLSSLVWPNLTRAFQKRMAKKKEKLRQRKYKKYIEKRKLEIEKETAVQSQILIENLLPLNECEKIILEKRINLWERRSDHKDYLTVRVGIGTCPIDMKINFSEQEFTIEEDELRKEVEDTINEAKMLKNVPIGYSFNNKKVTALMGKDSELYNFVDSILLQLLTFHSYDDLKIIFFVSKRNLNVWDKYKELFHCFQNNKKFRYFATDMDEAKSVSSFLEQELQVRFQNMKEDMVENEVKEKSFSPYYLIITDDYPYYRRLGIINSILKSKENCGFSLICVDNQLRRLPSECINFVYSDGELSTIYCTDINNFTIQQFKSETNYDVKIDECFKSLSNIPVEFEEEAGALPTALGFLEMFKVGKVEQLNTLNRWRLNNPMQSLRAQVGITNDGSPIYLDLHEKYMGPHGLIAGTTGSGKSEFIITFILSLALNYSPNEVAFILIDYKGGGLAGAFENKTLGLKLPHLAGTITNLDKASLNRTLVSIDSELKRRQKKFNEERDKLGESTIDIYKYQKFFREKKIKDPMPHLFIISDEFAELKSQQPEFMNDLISAARIGRSLGIHLILATQKPSGVVNDQIWSNSKFRVCLKVQNAGDSNEMLKSPEAASITNAGRFYLQVGNNEIFVLGQSGWAGTQYIPSNVAKKKYDRSISFIDGVGNVIKSIEDTETKAKVEDKGDELSNVLKYICNLAQKENLKSDTLWLDAIPDTIYVDDIIKKYNFKRDTTVTAVLGEYDAPSQQYQNILTVKFNDEGNTLIYGITGTNREMLLSSLIYSVCTGYSSEVINIYIVDYGSESLRIYNKFPQVGDIVFASESDKLNKLFGLINEEILYRKKLFADYNGEYKTYLKLSGKKMPLKIIIINNWDAFKEANASMEDVLAKFVREGERYGVLFVISATSQRSLYTKISNNFHNVFVLDMKDKNGYIDTLGKIGNLYPAEYAGRGLFKSDDVYEFQSTQICEVDNLMEFINKKVESVKKICLTSAPNIPSLPDVVTIEHLLPDLNSVTDLPIGIIRKNLKTYKYNFFVDKANILTSKDIKNCSEFLQTIIFEIRKLNQMVVFIDSEQNFPEINGKVNSYANKNLEQFILKFEEFLDSKIEGKNIKLLCVIAGLDKFKNSMNEKTFNGFFKGIKFFNNVNILFVDSSFKLKKLAYESWYTSNINNSNGIWIGPGFMEQNIISSSDYSNKYREKINKQFAWISKNGEAELVKIVGGLEKEDEK